MKTIVVFGVPHEFQRNGNIHNVEFERRLSFLIDEFSLTVLMEEWSQNQDASFASELVKNHLVYKNVGPGTGEEFRTFSKAPITWPGHAGRLGCRENAPPFIEYGPLDNQQNREDRMLQHIQDEMESQNSGLFIVGLAHLHSMSIKLRDSGFDVTSYEWTILKN